MTASAWGSSAGDEKSPCPGRGVPSMRKGAWRNRTADRLLHVGPYRLHIERFISGSSSEMNEEVDPTGAWGSSTTLPPAPGASASQCNWVGAEGRLSYCEALPTVRYDRLCHVSVPRLVLCTGTATPGASSMVLRKSDKLGVKRKSDHASANSQHAEFALDRLRSCLAPTGLDLVAPFSLDWCTDPEHPSLAAHLQNGSEGQAMAVLVGNSRKLWQPFLSHWRSSEDLQASENPLDTYIQTELVNVLSTDLKGLRWRICWPDTMTREGGPMAMQRLAHTIGFAYYDTTSHLCLHPKLGPWFSMRAVLVFDGLSYAGPSPQPPKCPLSAQTLAYIKMAVRSARTSMDAAESQPRSSEDSNGGPTSQHWQKWVAVREATCPGNPWKFDNRQMEYHYTHNTAALRKAISRKSFDARITT
ncbi:hypothetical protein WJX84_000118 [Apatococcus fuscideae]|uniref:Cyanocobalamin reductase (cyanide-eliminating) n=1 Tax=Apatococcus fuscideae TaxID=2026836 RepID=A0AAW1SV41_9CHLO